MKVSNLPSFLNDLYLNKVHYQSVLIDGMWGCGKTFNTQKFLNEDNPNVIYLSLFGMESENDLIISLGQFLDSTTISCIGGKYSINRNSYANKYNNCLIIFDDLERKNPKFSFSSFCGVVDSLINLGFKVVAVSYKNELEKQCINDQNFNDLMEKTFSVRLEVTADIGAYKEILNEISIIVTEEELSKADCNWRKFIRALEIYKDILEAIKDSGKQDFLDIKGLDVAGTYRCILYAF